MKETSPTPRRIPLNFFGMPFGLLGLADCWLVAAKFGIVPVGIGRVLTAVATVVWVVVLTAYLCSALSRPRGLVTDVTDVIAGPFASLAVIMPMLAAADALYPYSHSAGRVVVDIGIVATVVLGGLLIGDWISGPLQPATFHPGYFLPTVAGGFVASASAALVGQLPLARVLFGLGLISWLVLGSMVLGRLFLGPPLPTPLVPTIAIEVAPAGVGSFAYFAIHGDHITEPVQLMAGYGLVMILAQIRLIPMFKKLSFMPSFWSFTFSWAAVTFAAMFWLHGGHVAGWRVWIALLLAAITIFVGAIAARTVVAFRAGTIWPAPPAIPAAEPAAAH